MAGAAIIADRAMLEAVLRAKKRLEETARAFFC